MKGWEMTKQRIFFSPHPKPLLEIQKQTYLSWYHIQSNTACENIKIHFHYHLYNSRYLHYMLHEYCIQSDLCCMHQKEITKRKQACIQLKWLNSPQVFTQTSTPESYSIVPLGQKQPSTCLTAVSFCWLYETKCSEEHHHCHRHAEEG